MKKKYIGIIIPCYNCELFIENTIKSIVNQTFKDYKIILVDDGSKDSSIDVAQRILDSSNVEYNIIKKENGGVSSARNVGIENCDTEYLYMLDSDDYIDEDFLEKVSLKLKHYNADMMITSFDLVDEDNTSFLTYKNNLKTVMSGKEVLEKLFDREITLWTGSIFYKRELIIDNNFKYNEKCSNGEDQEFWTKAIFKSSTIVSDSNLIAHYQQRESSLTHTPSLKRFSTLGAVKRLKKYFIKNNAPEQYIKYLDENKFIYEFIGNIISIARQTDDLDILNPILNNKKFNKNLKKYKIRKICISEIKILIYVKLYTFNSTLFCKFINRYFKE